MYKAFKNLFIVTTFIGIFLFLIPTVKTYHHYTVYGTVIDKYKGKYDYEDANGVAYTNNMLYFVIKFDTEGIIRRDETEQIYYSYNIGSRISEDRTDYLNSTGWVLMASILISFVLAIYIDINYVFPFRKDDY